MSSEVGEKPRMRCPEATAPRSRKGSVATSSGLMDRSSQQRHTNSAPGVVGPKLIREDCRYSVIEEPASIMVIPRNFDRKGTQK